MNNLVKNVGIWAVILHGGAGRGQAVRRAAAGQGCRFLFRIHGLGQERQGRVGHGRGPQDQLDVDRQEEIHDLQSRRHLDGRRPAEVRRQGRQQAGRGAIVPVADLHLLVPDAVADRRLDLLHAPDARRRQGRRVFVRQEQGTDAGRGEQHRHVRRRGRLRRGQGGSRRTGRIPARPVQVPEAGRPHSARRADGRVPGHGQDAARQSHRGRGQGPVLLDLRVGLRRDVRRRGRGARARHVRAGEEERAVHRVHRRNRRGRAASVARAWAAATTSASRR